MDNTVYILYVEDNESDVELFMMSIERYCSTVNIVLDVAEGIKAGKALFDPNKHKAAFLDWNLPDGEGIEVAQYIRADYKSFPIFLLSSVFSDKNLRIAEKYKPIACLEKDYDKRFIEQIQHYFNTECL